ncbi:MAG: hypothetical protein GY832_11250 [Chloroflexi bacterium]|nr:hypothetical protein [Chloroflexota bacterium]
MDASKLAMKMLEWETKRRELDELEAKIKTAVLDIAKTQTVGNVRASYRTGSKRYDYQEAADGHPIVSDATISLFTKPVVDWRGICKHAGIDDIPFEQGKPSVSIKLLD